MTTCPVCGEELEEINPGIDNWMDDCNDVTMSFIVRTMQCNNPECPLFGKQLDIFFDFSRIEADGDKIDIDGLREEFERDAK